MRIGPATRGAGFVNSKIEGTATLRAHGANPGLFVAVNAVGNKPRREHCVVKSKSLSLSLRGAETSAAQALAIP